MTWLKFVNMFLLQWFFIRLTKCQEKVIREFNIHSVGMLPDGSFAPAGIVKYDVHTWYSLQYWMIPFTGWQGSFMYVFKHPTLLRITPKK